MTARGGWELWCPSTSPGEPLLTDPVCWKASRMSDPLPCGLRLAEHPQVKPPCCFKKCKLPFLLHKQHEQSSWWDLWEAIFQTIVSKSCKQYGTSQNSCTSPSSCLQNLSSHHSRRRRARQKLRLGDNRDQGEGDSQPGASGALALPLLPTPQALLRSRCWPS